MAKAPAFQFYPGDWRRDVGVQSLDYEHRGMWIELLCMMWFSDERGRLVLPSGDPLPDGAIARNLGIEEAEWKQKRSTLLTFGVASEDEAGVFYNRRMVRDEVTRRQKADAGRKGGLRSRPRSTTEARRGSATTSPSTTTQSSVSIETGASPVVENSENEQMAWGDFAGWFRTGGYVTLWGGPTPPRDAPRDWTLNNDLSIAKRLSGKTDLKIIRGVIEAGVWSEKTQSFERDRGITLAWYADKDDPERWAIAVGKYEIRQLPVGKKSRRGGLEKIEVELGGAV